MIEKSCHKTLQRAAVRHVKRIHTCRPADLLFFLFGIFADHCDLDVSSLIVTIVTRLF